MNTRIFTIALVALSMGVGGFAQAQGQQERGNPRDRTDNSQRSHQDDRRDHMRNDRNDRYERTDRNDRNDRRDQWRSDRYHRADQSSAGYGRSWHRGDRLPMAYRSRHYVVEDWRGHQLYAPPRGQYWVQNGSDYFLVAIATGVIASILLSN